MRSIGAATDQLVDEEGNPIIEEEVQHVVNFGLANGFIGFWFLSCPASFRIAPPLVTTMEEAEWACNLMHQAFDALP